MVNQSVAAPVYPLDLSRGRPAATCACEGTHLPRIPELLMDGAVFLFRTRQEAIARAAIEAMREPTRAMTSAAWLETTGEDAGAVWKTMIDAALNEKKPGHHLRAAGPSRRLRLEPQATAGRRDGGWGGLQKQREREEKQQPSWLAGPDRSSDANNRGDKSRHHNSINRPVRKSHFDS